MWNNSTFFLFIQNIYKLVVDLEAQVPVA